MNKHPRSPGSARKLKKHACIAVHGKEFAAQGSVVMLGLVFRQLGLSDRDPNMVCLFVACTKLTKRKLTNLVAPLPGLLTTDDNQSCTLETEKAPGPRS